MHFRHKKPWLLLAACLTAFCACNDSHHDHHHSHDHEEEAFDHDHEDEAHGHEHEAHGHDDIHLSEERAKAAGVAVQTATRSTFHNVIQTSGSLQAASCDETTIVATVSGIVTHAQHISEGMSLSKGTTIYYISSDKLQDGDQARRIELAYEAAKREYDRALPLLDEQIISQKDFTAIKNEYDRARLAYDAIGHITSPRGVAVKAPVTGYMKECMVTDGDYVNVGDPLMTVTRNQHLYLRVEVPVRYYSLLSHINSAKFRTQYSDRVFNLAELDGELLSSGKSAVSTSSYVPVTFKLDNHGDIVPGSYAEVFLTTGERPNVLTVPTTALTEEQGVYYVYIQEDAETYHKREVILGDTDGEFTEIVSGLSGGEQIVVRGAINVRLAAATNAIPAHTHNH